MEPVSSGPNHEFVGVANVLVCVYSGAPPASALFDRVPWIERVIEEHGAGGIFVVVDPRGGGMLPDRRFREVSREQTERFGEHILFSATVIEGSGMQHTIVRTFLRSLAAFAGPDIPVRFFDRVQAASKWAAALAKNHGGPSAEDIEAAVRELRG